MALQNLSYLTVNSTNYGLLQFNTLPSDITNNPTDSSGRTLTDTTWPWWISNAISNFNNITRPNITIDGYTAWWSTQFAHLKLARACDGVYNMIRLYKDQTDILCSFGWNINAEDNTGIYIGILFDDENEFGYIFIAGEYGDYGDRKTIKYYGGNSAFGQFIYQSIFTGNYTWSSVPSISGKNGILSLSTLNDINNGEAITTSDTTKINLQSTSNVETIVKKIINNW